ncbi:uncharacterized protein FOMMEDRAFT_111066 [Fomitiporia mediterranea MF3/22]|uniref:uncharacterized protein n=1 Tax=Fomitiporia mediterranea (strain MF3/22) TaxID=694068 RepID=UPI0004407674|nr:uncharacterized protein FOMMEDRAFT_111066 [Fomitiporia mediterranea MF3/22]EJD01329.1 hypothetical protein FOMMEDRAFT_111066 [Fomitiporia mediterranea MF3/22]
MLLTTIRTASRHATRCSPCRLKSTNARFPSASGSKAQIISDPKPSSTDQPPPPPTDNTPSSEQQKLHASPVPSAAASPPPPPPPQSETQAHPYAGAKEYADNQESAKNAVIQSNLPALLQQERQNNSGHIYTYATPPFDTHRFYTALEKTFPESIANSLMRATRALLVDRIGRVKREALSVKNLENQAYLFRAALSEARNEISLRQRNDSATIRTSLAALRREIDSLDGRMKSDIANLKHELQMDVDNRKTESKTDLKQMDIQIEEVLNKAIVSIGEMKTMTEQMKWENMYRAVLALGFFAVSIIVTFEFNHRPQAKKKTAEGPPEPLPGPKQNEVLDGLEGQMT